MSEEERRPRQAAGDETGGVDRARRRAQATAQALAERLADTAEDIAGTLDRVAAVREARAADAVGCEAETRKRSAQRARQKAEGERRDGRELRETWNLPKGDASGRG